MAQYGFHLNIKNCIGCRACEAACKQEYDLPVGVRRRKVTVIEGGEYPKPFRHYVSMACNHCKDPACLNACPVGAYTKESEFGLVLHDVDKCTGCKRCVAACPYGAPQYNAKTKKIDKCSGCYHRLKDANLKEPGQNLPACVITCPGIALQFDDISVIDGGKFGDAQKTTALKPDIVNPALTTPNIRFTRP